MIKGQLRFLLGCVVAPLAAPLTMLMIMMATAEDLRGPSYKYAFDDVVESFGIAGIFLFLGAPIAYAVTILIGLPSFFLAKKLGFINFYTVTIGSAFVAIFPIVLMSAPNGFTLYDDPEKSSFLFYISIALCGLVVGLVFWFMSGLYKQPAHNK